MIFKKLINLLLIVGAVSFLLISCDLDNNEKVSELTITYNSNSATGGTVPLDGNKYKKDDEVTILGNLGNLKKENYNFIGWSETPTGELKYSAGNKLTITENITLYASWVEVIPPGTFKFSKTLQNFNNDNLAPSQIKGLIVDSNGNIFIATNTGGSGSIDKFAPHTSNSWVNATSINKLVPILSINNSDTSDLEGFSYTKIGGVEYVYFTKSGDYEVYRAPIDLSSYSLLFTSNNSDAYHVESDFVGNIYYSGYSTNDFLLLKYDENNADTNYLINNYNAHDIEVENDKTIYIAENNFTTKVETLVKLTADNVNNLTVEWSKDLGTGSDDNFFGIEIDSSNVYVADDKKNKLTVYNKSGVFITDIDIDGKPYRIFADDKSIKKTLYVMLQKDNKLQINVYNY